MVLTAKLSVPRVGGLDRPRLAQRLAELWDRRAGFLVAPAGSGKTTLLAQFAGSAGVPVAWYRAEPSDGSTAQLLAHLEQSLVAALGVGGGWRSIDEAVAVIEDWPGGRALLVLDDVHAIGGSEAEPALGRLLEMLPANIRVLAASRSAPGVNLTRLRLDGALLELGADDLRFRSWEIERLFRHHYREPMGPEDLSALARHTEGWAAGLQLFHLATTGKPLAQRRRILAELSSRSRLVREYLTRNVLDELPPETRRFLLHTSVLGLLSGALCDELLGRTGSDGVLEQLERRQIFTFTADDGATYRYHEVLRSYLEGQLVAAVGEPEVRRRSARAAGLLEAAGAASEALRSYCRAGDGAGVARLLGRRGEELAGDAGTWLEGLPPALVAGDPWLQLAAARWHRAGGRLAAALAAYRQAEAGLDRVASESCRRERLALAQWAEPMAAQGGGPGGILRRATQRHPEQAAAEARAAGGPGASLVAALATLLAGRPREARFLLDEVVLASEADPLAGAAAGVAARVAEMLSGVPPGQPGLEELAALCERLGVPALARLARAFAALVSEAAVPEAIAVAALCEADGDRWGATLATMAAGMGAVVRGTPEPEALERAADTFRGLGAGVLEVWCRAFAALGAARAGDPEAARGAASSEAMARAAAVPGAQAVALAASAEADPARGAGQLAAARVLGAECGLALPPPPAGPRPVPASGAATGPGAPTPAGPAGLWVRCLGGFEVRRGGDPVDLAAVRPRARAVLQLLAAAGGRSVHWEVVAEALWPGCEARAGARSLHVAVSSLRHALAPDGSRRGAAVIVRRGDAYSLEVDGLDVSTFEAHLDAARRSGAAGDRRAEAVALDAALALYGGDLLPEAGPAEWVLKDRDRFQRLAADAAGDLAELRLADGDPAGAARAAERGLGVDPWRDRLWRLRLEALDAAGDRAALARARLAFDALLAGDGPA